VDVDMNRETTLGWMMMLDFLPQSAANFGFHSFFPFIRRVALPPPRASETQSNKSSGVEIMSVAN
jgi:hypothetical protein